MKKMRRRKRKHSDLKGTVLGVAWYSPTQWALLKAAVPDPEKLEKTYEEWEAMASASFARLEESGLDLERVQLEAEEFLAWCSSNELEPDSGARSQFAAEKIRQRKLAEDDKKPALAPPDRPKD